MISVAEALAEIFKLVSALDTEVIPLREARGRVQAKPVSAARNQPPFRASVMDGYAIHGDKAPAGAGFDVIGESAAGRRYEGSVGPGQAVRIFTGAPVPAGCERVVIQEDVDRLGSRITIKENADKSRYIRAMGADFKVGDTFLVERPMTPSDVALLGSLNAPTVCVYRRPVVAIVATGDELVQPGEAARDDQIVASNALGLAALIEQHGAIARILPIARDTALALDAVLAMAAGADLIVTIGGASVGDHDLVSKLATDGGMSRSFYKVAMRPGKPLMAGRLADTPLIGLPGNPVSAMVCGHVFIVPAIAVMQGLFPQPAPRRMARLAEPLSANGGREHYMRATVNGDLVHVANTQDSGLLSVLAQSNALIVRPPNSSKVAAGANVEIIDL